VLARAAEHAAAQGVTNISFREASVYALPFGDGEFDVVHAHQVLCHLDRPVEAVREMLRVCRPGGGVVALREADMRMWCFWPEGKGGGLERFRGLMADVLVAIGGQVMGGWRLVEWVMVAGVGREGIEAGFGTWCYSEPGDRRVWGEFVLSWRCWDADARLTAAGEAMIERLRTGQMRTKGLEMGLVTEEGIEEMIKAWEEWIETADATLGIMNGEVIVTKA
jgi:SAM-dependent methyltransferase